MLRWAVAAWAAGAALAAPTDDRGFAAPDVPGPSHPGLGVVGGAPAPEAAGGPVVGIAGPDGVFCTGVAVDARWVLTAAHCLAADPPPAEVWWGADLRGGPDVAIAVDLGASRASPSWAAGDRAHDVALLALVTAAPGPVAGLAEGAPAAGDRLDVFGFGDTSDGAGDRGVLRTATLDVLDADTELVYTYTPGKNLCSGDSGAPLVVPGSDPPLVRAVGGFVDPTCLGGAGGGAHVEAVWPFLVAAVPTLERSPLPQRRDTGDTGEGADTGEPPAAIAAPGRGCGCDGTGGAPWLGLGLALAARRRGAGVPHRGAGRAAELSHPHRGAGRRGA